jgi:tRNA U34 2-thiouridine synthase MnmA/TrmU
MKILVDMSGGVDSSVAACTLNPCVYGKQLPLDAAAGKVSVKRIGMRLRFGMKEVNGTGKVMENGCAEVSLEYPCPFVFPGQSAVFYNDETVLRSVTFKNLVDSGIADAGDSFYYQI